MSKFECDKCDYKTDRKSNYDRHLESAKHTEEKIVHECNYCHKIFSHYQSKWKHQTERCKERPELKQETDKDQIIGLLLEEVKELRKEREENREERKGFMNIIEGNSKTANKSISAMAYVVKHYNKAPAIKKLSDAKVIKMLEYKGEDPDDNLTTEEKLTIEYRGNRLHRYLGNIIVDTFKDAENPSKQSVWASDTARLSFVIMKGIEKGKKEWTEDKCGAKIMNLIIDPLLIKVKKILGTHSSNCYKKINSLDFGNNSQKNKLNEDSESDELDSDYDSGSSNSDKSIYKKSNDYLLTEMETIMDIRETIDKRTLHDKLLKFICPYFKLQLNK